MVTLLKYKALETWIRCDTNIQILNAPSLVMYNKSSQNGIKKCMRLFYTPTLRFNLSSESPSFFSFAMITLASIGSLSPTKL